MYDCFLLCDNYDKLEFTQLYSAWKLSKYGVFSSPYFPVFSPNTGKYGPEITPYLDNFHAVNASTIVINIGESNTKTWYNPFSTVKSYLKESFTLTRLWALLCIDCVNLTNLSSRRSFLKTQQIISLWVRSKAFSELVNAKNRSFVSYLFLLWLFQDENDACSPIPCYETKLYLIYVSVFS